MKSVNIAELKKRLSFYLNEARAGHEVIVRLYGRRHWPAAAKLFPVDSSYPFNLGAAVLRGRDLDRFRFCFFLLGQNVSFQKLLHPASDFV